MLNLPPQPEPEERPLSPSGAPYPEKSWLDQKIGQLARWANAPEQSIMMAPNPLAMVSQGEMMGSQYLQAIARLFQRGRQEFPMVAPGSQGNVYAVPERVTDMFKMPKGLTIKDMSGEDAMREGLALQKMQNVAPGSTKPYVGTVTSAARDIPKAEPGMDPIAAMSRGQMIPGDAEAGYLFTRRVPMPPKGPVPETQLKNLAADATRAGLRTDISQSASHAWTNPEGPSAVAMDLGGWSQGGRPQELHRMNMAEAKSAAGVSEAEWARRQAIHNDNNRKQAEIARQWIAQRKAQQGPKMTPVIDSETGMESPMLESDWLKLRHEWR